MRPVGSAPRTDGPATATDPARRVAEGATAPLRVPGSGGPRPGAPLASRLVRAAVAGGAVAAAVVVGRTTGVLLGGAGLGLAALLVVLVPTSRDLSRRLLLAGCLLLGWTAVAWWWPLPVGGLGRVTVGLALLGGGLAAWVGSGARPGERARRLLPRWRRADLLVPLAAAAAVAVVTPYLRVRTAEQAMALLLSGYDNVAHFSMVHMTRRSGVTVDALGPRPDGATWQFDSYPQGFHAVIAAVVELRAGPVPGDAAAELVRYTSAVALFVVLVVAVLVAGFCSLPVVRTRPALALPVAAFVSAVVLVGPGAHALQGGIGNFTQACVLVVAAALLVVPLARVWAPLPMAALGGAVVGIATSWVLLLALVAPVLVALLLPLQRRRWAAPRGRIAVVAVLAVLVVLGLARTASVLLRVRADSPLTTTPGFVPVDVGLALAAALGTAGTCLLVGRAPGPRRRVAALAAVPVVGLAVYATLAGLQIASAGRIGYYPAKFLLGLLVVALLLLVVPVVHLVARPPARSRAARLRGALGAGALALALTQVFGLTAPDLSERGLPPGAEGLRNRAQQIAAVAAPPATADLADRLARSAPPPTTVVYLDLPGGGPVDPVLVAQWYLSLTDTWTAEANTLVSAVRLGSRPGADAEAADTARRVLLADPDALVAVRPTHLGQLVRTLDDPSLTRRVVAF